MTIVKPGLTSLSHSAFITNKFLQNDFCQIKSDFELTCRQWFMFGFHFIVILCIMKIIKFSNHLIKPQDSGLSLVLKPDLVSFIMIDICKLTLFVDCK